MNLKENKLKNIIEKSLLKSLDKINKISSSSWDIDLNIKEDTQDYDTILSYFDFNYEDKKIILALYFNKKELDLISKYFIGFSFLSSEIKNKSKELLVDEIANIVLNSIISQIANTLKKKIIPNVPKIINSQKKIALEIIAESLDNKGEAIFNARFIAKGKDKEIYFDLIGFFPLNLID